MLGRLFALEMHEAVANIYRLAPPGAVEQHQAVLEIPAKDLFPTLLQGDFIDPDLSCLSTEQKLNPCSPGPSWWLRRSGSPAATASSVGTVWLRP